MSSVIWSIYYDVHVHERHTISTFVWHAYRVDRDLIIGHDLQVARFLARRRDTSNHNFEPKLTFALLLFNNYALTRPRSCLVFLVISFCVISFIRFLLADCLLYSFTPVCPIRFRHTVLHFWIKVNRDIRQQSDSWSSASAEFCL
jgi:hypothetical protein